MRIISIIIVALIFSSSAEAKRLDDETLNNWMTYYYKHPNPELMSDAIETLHSVGYFKKNNAIAPMSSFFGSIYSKNEEKIIVWSKLFESYEENEKIVLIYALWHSNTDTGINLLQKLKNTTTHKELINKLLNSPYKGIDNIEITSPAVLDMLWGAFLATGNLKYVDRIITVLPWTEVKGDTAKLLIGGAARWSVTSNAVQHDIIFKHCNSILEKQPKEIMKILSEIIRIAEEERNKRGV